MTTEITTLINIATTLNINLEELPLNFKNNGDYRNTTHNRLIVQVAITMTKNLTTSKRENNMKEEQNIEQSKEQNIDSDLFLTSFDKTINNLQTITKSSFKKHINSLYLKLSAGVVDAKELSELIGKLQKFTTPQQIQKGSKWSLSVLKNYKHETRECVKKGFYNAEKKVFSCTDLKRMHIDHNITSPDPDKDYWYCKKDGWCSKDKMPQEYPDIARIVDGIEDSSPYYENIENYQFKTITRTPLHSTKSEVQSIVEIDGNFHFSKKYFDDAVRGFGKNEYILKIRRTHDKNEILKIEGTGNSSHREAYIMCLAK